MNGLLGSENELIEDYKQNPYLPSLWTGIDGISLRVSESDFWLGGSTPPLLPPLRVGVLKIVTPCQGGSPELSNPKMTPPYSPPQSDFDRNTRPLTPPLSGGE